MWQIRKIINFENSKNLQCGEFEKFPKISNFEEHQISKIFQFRTIINFQNTTIYKTIKIP